MSVVSILSLLATILPTNADWPHNEISLNGSWECYVVDDLRYPPQADIWRSCQVPGCQRGHDYQRAWFRRSFNVTEVMRGKRIKLPFGGVKYNSRVYVDGNHVGGCFGGYRQFEIDVTDAVRFGKPNELLVGCHDWTGAFNPCKVDFGRKRGSREVRSVPRDRPMTFAAAPSHPALQGIEPEDLRFRTPDPPSRTSRIHGKSNVVTGR